MEMKKSGSLRERRRKFVMNLIGKSLSKMKNKKISNYHNLNINKSSDSSHQAS